MNCQQTENKEVMWLASSSATYNSPTHRKLGAHCGAESTQASAHLHLQILLMFIKSTVNKFSATVVKNVIQIS